MNYLVDTSVLVRALHSADPDSAVARRALTSAVRGGDDLYVIPQIVAEFWAAATRLESENGPGFAPERAGRMISRYSSVFELRFETQAVYQEWRTLAAEYRVRGKQARDARIAAAVRTHRIGRVLTFNTKDFARHRGVAAVHPADI